MPRSPRPERRPLNEGADPLDRYCRACGALPGEPCTVKGVQSPPSIRTRDDERAWKLSHIRHAQAILRRLDGRQAVPLAELVHQLRQANRSLIHDSR